MRDVAALAGVSLKTVSRVVNSEPHTRPEVVARVRAAIAELGWVPNGSARVLRTGRTGVVGIGVARLRRPYSATLVEALVGEAGTRGMTVVVEPHQSEPDRLRQWLSTRGHDFDGVVHIGPLPLDADLSGALGAAPLVVLQGGPRPDADTVDDDVEQAVLLVARHLALMGRRRPVLLGRDRGHRAGQDDGSGLSATFAAALTGAGLDPATVRVLDLPGPADRKAGAVAAARALTWRRTDSLVCSNDEVALGALSALAAAGVEVPRDVAVIGYDNLDDGRFSTPTLTTVDPRPHRLARTALELLGDRLAGTAPPTARSVVVPVDLVRRSSTLGGAE